MAVSTNQAARVGASLADQVSWLHHTRRVLFGANIDANVGGALRIEMFEFSPLKPLKVYKAMQC